MKTAFTRYLTAHLDTLLAAFALPPTTLPDDAPVFTALALVERAAAGDLSLDRDGEAFADAVELLDTLAHAAVSADDAAFWAKYHWLRLRAYAWYLDTEIVSQAEAAVALFGMSDHVALKRVARLVRKYDLLTARDSDAAGSRQSVRVLLLQVQDAAELEAHA